MHNQMGVSGRDENVLTQELEKIKAWGNQVAEVAAALADLSQYGDSYCAPRLPGCSLPEQSLGQLSNLFHEVPTPQSTCSSSARPMLT